MNGMSVAGVQAGAGVMGAEEELNAYLAQRTQIALENNAYLAQQGAMANSPGRNKDQKFDRQTDQYHNAGAQTYEDFPNSEAGTGVKGIRGEDSPMYNEKHVEKGKRASEMQKELAEQ